MARTAEEVQRMVFWGRVYSSVMTRMVHPPGVLTGRESLRDLAANEADDAMARLNARFPPEGNGGEGEQ